MIYSKVYWGCLSSIDSLINSLSFWTFYLVFSGSIFKLILIVKIIMCIKLLNFEIKKEKILLVILLNKYTVF